MQTFLPYRDFRQSALCLDRQRLGKQRVEVLQLLKTLVHGGGWSNHPAALMWRGYEDALAIYGLIICDEWRRRGYKDTCREKILHLKPNVPTPYQPWWLGMESFHASHRSNLLRKDPEHYGKMLWSEPHDLPYH